MKLKEKQTGEKITVIDIELTRGLVAALSCVLLGVSLLAYLALTGERVAASEVETSGQASSAQSTGKRWFYVTETQFEGSEALAACAPGYHMASVWEIADPTNLRYNTALGYTRDDSGQGPPSQLGAWVRTGHSANSQGVLGQDNCDVWSSKEQDDHGSAALLHSFWELGTEDVGVWSAWHQYCSEDWRVWCIED